MEKIIYVSTDNLKPIYGYIYVTYYNGVPVYVGQSSILTYKHTTNYKGSGVILKKALNKYGKENFFTVMVDYAKSLDELNKKEIFSINKYNTLLPKYGGNGYNISSRGTGIGTYKRGQENPASSTNMSAEKRIKKAIKGAKTYKKHVADGTIKPRKHSESEKKLFSQLAKERWAAWKQTGRADEITSKSVFHNNEFNKKWSIYGSKKAQEVAKLLGNPNAKIWYAISPDGIKYVIRGDLKGFCKNHLLSYPRIRRFINKGPIPLPRTQNKTVLTLNSIGWVVSGGKDFVRKRLQKE